MAPAKTVSKNLKLERMTTSQLRNRLENILNEINKENSEHMIAVVHPNVQECEVEEVSQTEPSDLEAKNTFCSKRLGRCPHCRKRMDVSKIPEIRNRLKCQRKICGKTTTMKKWLCVNCSRTKGRDIEFDNCWCWARSLVQKGETILACPQKGCNGWKRFEAIDLPDCRHRPKKLRARCDSCRRSTSTKDWICNSCSKGKTEIKFEECSCCTNLAEFLKPENKKSKKTAIVLACPRKKCRKTKHFKKKELSQIVMKKLAETRLMCTTCCTRTCIWKWKCYKCKKLSCKCTCKQIDSCNESTPLNHVTDEQQ